MRRVADEAARDEKFCKHVGASRLEFSVLCIGVERVAVVLETSANEIALQTPSSRCHWSA